MRSFPFSFLTHYSNVSGLLWPVLINGRIKENLTLRRQYNAKNLSFNKFNDIKALR